jgi:HEAT repeat protein
METKLQTPNTDELPDLPLEQQIERLGSRDWRVVGAATEALTRAASNGIAAVLQGLSHPQARVRRGCAQFMDHQGTDDCVELLCQVARDDPVPNVRRVAVHSLGCQRCKPSPLHGDTIAFLVERALSDPSVKVRREAVGGLSLHPPDPRAAAALRRLLEEETDRELRRSAHYALKRHDLEYRRNVDEGARTRAMAAHARRWG